MSPWKLHNPFWDNEPEEEPKPVKPIPSTMVRVRHHCVGNALVPIDIRVRKRDNGRRVISCHNCLKVIEVTVNNLKSIQVFISNQDGSDRHRVEHERIWQE